MVWGLACEKNTAVIEANPIRISPYERLGARLVLRRRSAFFGRGSASGRPASFVQPRGSSFCFFCAAARASFCCCVRSLTVSRRTRLTHAGYT